MTDSADWAGRIGDIWAQEWRRTDRSFEGLAPHLDAAVLAVAPDGPFTALDIGSGAGATSIALADARADAVVTGVDLSAGLVAIARTRAGDRTNLRFANVDALAEAKASGPFDLLVSRHGVMFFADPVAAFTTLREATAPGGHLVFSCFAISADNPWATLATEPRSDPSGPGPFAFADPTKTKALLTAGGWSDATPHRVDYTYRAGAGEDPVADALAFFGRIGPVASALKNASGADRDRLLAQVSMKLAAQQNGCVVDFPAAAWIWTARAGEPT